MDGERQRELDQIELRKTEAELKRIEAEQKKTELEASEIERRLTAKWWQGSKLTQYVFASVISAAVLFAWAKTYYEPISSLKTEINKLENERLDSLRKTLEVRQRTLEIKQQNLAEANNSLLAERAKLIKGNSQLEE